MAPNDVEKAGDLDGTESTANSEKIEPGLLAEGAYGEPDCDHKEVEQMDEGHLDDLVRQQVSSNSQAETFCLSPVRPWHRLMLVPEKTKTAFKG
jgi:hypothetical protein